MIIYKKSDEVYRVSANSSTSIDVLITKILLQCIYESNLREDIARKSGDKGLKKTSIYSYLKKLEKLGYVKHYEKNTKIYYELTEKGSYLLKGL
jgi:DNA-binding PadR family transcriptional regulator